MRTYSNNTKQKLQQLPLFHMKKNPVVNSFFFKMDLHLNNTTCHYKNSSPQAKMQVIINRHSVSDYYHD